MNTTQLRELAEAATPGETVATGNGVHIKSRCVLTTHMEQPEQRHADAKFYAAANPAAVLALLDRIKELEDGLQALLDLDQLNTCQHESTYRGGALWEICDDCDAKWADDRGGKPKWKDPEEWVVARTLLEKSK